MAVLKKLKLPKLSRTGSVLILVVSLLVMLALMGTAYIATARIERVAIASAAGPNAGLVPMDGLATNEIGRIEAELVNDIIVTNRFRPVETPPLAATSYRHNTSPFYDEFLADRIPTAEAAGGGFPTPLAGYRFVTELGVAPTNLQTGAAIPWIRPFINTVSNVLDPTSERLIPDSVTIDYRAAGIDAPSLVVPAFRRQVIAATPAATPSAAFIAADANGDGMADSLLYQIPATPATGGITYWASAYVVDNSSAINASLALSQTNDLDFTYAYPARPTPITTLGAAVDPFGRTPPTINNMGVFPTHVGFAEMLNNYPAGTSVDEMGRWQEYRSNLHTLDPYSDVLPGPSVALRGDFDFVSQGDAISAQLGRRLSNPGYYSTTAKYKSGEADAPYLAFRGGLIDITLNSNPALSNLSAFTAIEQAMASSVYFSALNWVSNQQNQWTQYPANQPTYWFDYSYYDGVTVGHPSSFPAAIQPTAVPAGAYRSIRPFLAMSNAESNAIQAHSPTVALTVPAVTPAMTPYRMAGAYPNIEVNPSKVSINTATFSQLWWGFWNVMSTDVAPHTAPHPDGVTSIFSSPPPEAGAPTIVAGEMHLLRSALAAANTIAMRDGVLEPAAFDITFGAGPSTVRVYANTPQVFIVSATLNAGNMDVVLYNPTDVAVSTAGMSFAAMSGGSMSGLAVAGMPASIPPMSATTASGVITVSAPPLPATWNTVKLYLLKTLTTVPAPTAPIALNDAIPLDMVDTTTAGTGSTPANDYLRNFTVGSADWRCVWPSAGFTVGPTVTPAGTNATPLATIAFNVPLTHSNYGGPNRPTAAPHRFPFGGFCRDGDLTQIPFIASYRIGTAVPYTFVSVTMDARYAGYGAATPTPANELPGHFAPLAAVDVAHTGADPYSWAGRLFDYFTTIQNQDSDTLPSVMNTTVPYAPAAAPVTNDKATPANGDLETHESVSQGRININTAPYEVLRRIPFTNVPATNDLIARAIIADRNINGPFNNIFELNTLTDGTTNTFQNGWGTLWTTVAVSPTYNPTYADGEFTLATLTAPGFVAPPPPIAGVPSPNSPLLMIRKISNLVTTRSDTFTAYVLVQAWQDAGTATPKLLSQVRKAAIIDRSRVTLSGASTARSAGLRTTNAPN